MIIRVWQDSFEKSEYGKRMRIMDIMKRDKQKGPSRDTNKRKTSKVAEEENAIMPSPPSLSSYSSFLL
jgi:hypothetical protein